jgi:hypothetical protein
LPGRAIAAAIASVDPAIHPAELILFLQMDALVNPRRQGDGGSRPRMTNQEMLPLV